MTPDWLIPALLVLVILLAALGAWRRLRLWRRGRPAPAKGFPAVPLLAGLARVPRRYAVNLHDVVIRDRQAANFHVPAAGGVMVGLPLVILVHGLGLDPAWLAWPLIGVMAIMAVGVAMAARRRYLDRPARISRGAWDRLPASLMVFALAFAAISLPATGLIPGDAYGVAGTVLLGLAAAFGLAEILPGASFGGPMKHAFAGALHLAWHPRPGRFSQTQPEADLKPVDLGANKYGVETPQDFAWNQLLGFDACVQCGRCEAACPAHAAGQPLNPKKLIQDLVVGLSGPGTDAGYAGTPYVGGRAPGESEGAPDRAVVPDLIAPETLWACTTCRACVEECPMFIEHVDAIIDLRRFLTMEKGAVPGKGGETLENLRATDNLGGRDPARRAAWAVDLDAPLMAEKGEAEILYWVGEAAFDLSRQRTPRALVSLMSRAGVDFAILGTEEADCGDAARRLGDDATFQELARRNIDTLSKYRFERIVTADPHAFNSLANDYPALGGRYEVVHHTTFLAELVRAGRLSPAEGALEGPVTYHDPCYLGRYNYEFDAPRELLRAMGADLREMTLSGRRSRCCGWGGGSVDTDIPGRARISEMRMADADATGAGTVAVACPNCATMFDGAVEAKAHPRDIAELMLEAVER